MGRNQYRAPRIRVVWTRSPSLIAWRGVDPFFRSRVHDLAGSVTVQRAVLEARPSETNVVRTDACTYVTAILYPS